MLNVFRYNQTALQWSCFRPPISEIKTLVHVRCPLSRVGEKPNKIEGIKKNVSDCCAQPIMNTALGSNTINTEVSTNQSTAGAY